MKEIVSTEISDFSSVLSSKLDCGLYVLTGKCECFSTKLHNQTLKRKMEYRFEPVPKDKQGFVSGSPNNWSPLSPFGLLTNDHALKQYCELIEVLNLSYPDFSFDNIRPDEFSKEKLGNVMNNLNQKLSEGFSVSDRMSMWNIFAQRLGPLDQCDIYSYTPTNVMDDDEPFGVSNGKLWHDTYFFISKKEKLIMFLTLAAQEKRSLSYYQSDSDDSDYDMSNLKNMDYYIQPQFQSRQWVSTREIDDMMDEDDFSQEW